jgi:hypothetical protein
MSSRILSLISFTVVAGLMWGTRFAFSNFAGSEYASSQIIVSPRTAFSRASVSVQIGERVTPRGPTAAKCSPPLSRDCLPPKSIPCCRGLECTAMRGCW